MVLALHSYLRSNADYEGIARVSNQNGPKQGLGRWKVWLVAPLLAGTVLFFILFKNHRNSNAKKKAPTPHAIPVDVASSLMGDIGVYVEALGTVTPVYTVNIVSRVQGQITEINYREGQFVHKGDSLLVIDPRPYQAAVDQAKGQLEHDQAVLKEAQIDLSRYKKAFARNAIPKQQLDDQVQVVLQDQGTVKADEGSLELASANLDYAHINSPIGGRVGLRLIDPGNMVQANSTTPLVVITQLQPIDVIFNVSEDHISEVQEQLAQQKKLSVDLFDRTQQKKIATGKLLTLDNVVDPTTGTVKFKAEFENKDNSLFPNQFVNARLLVDTEKQQILLTTAAIQRDAQGTFVYVVKSDKSVEMRPIKEGVVDGNTIAVKGLNTDESVVIDGFDKLQEGMKVAIRESDGKAGNQQTQKSHEQENANANASPSPPSAKP